MNLGPAEAISDPVSKQNNPGHEIRLKKKISVPRILKATYKSILAVSWCHPFLAHTLASFGHLRMIALYTSITEIYQNEIIHSVCLS